MSAPARSVVPVRGAAQWRARNGLVVALAPVRGGGSGVPRPRMTPMGLGLQEW